MPKDEPTEEEIRKITEKAEKIASEGKKEPPLKTPKGKSDSGGTKEPIKEKKEEPTREAEKSSPEVEALKDEMVVLKKDMSDVKGFLKKMVERAEEMRAEGEGSEAKTTKEGEAVTGEEEGQGEAQEELTPEQELKILQQKQAKETGGEAGGEAPSKSLLTYLAAKIFDNATKGLVAYFNSRAAGGGGEGTSFSKLAEEIVLEQLKRQMTGQARGAGDSMISLDVLNTLSKFQGNLLGSFFNAIGKLPKDMGETIVKSAIESRSGIEGPPSGTKEAIE